MGALVAQAGTINVPHAEPSRESLNESMAASAGLVMAG